MPDWLKWDNTPKWARKIFVALNGALNAALTAIATGHPLTASMVAASTVLPFGLHKVTKLLGRILDNGKEFQDISSIRSAFGIVVPVKSERKRIAEAKANFVAGFKK